MASLPSSARKKVAAIVSRPERPEVGRVLPDLLTWLRDHGYEVIIEPQTSNYIQGEQPVPLSRWHRGHLDLVVVLGGDGTLLSAVRATAATDAPLLGVNLGSLGFLTDVPLSSLFQMLDSIVKGQAPTEQRTLNAM